MKKYKINKVTSNNPSGNMQWRFAGSTTDYKKVVEEFEAMKGRDGVKGLRITDTETNTVVYERII